jgi:hypothetical protein
MSKTEYKYYLETEGYIEYSFSPDSIIINVIDSLMRDYFKIKRYTPPIIWVAPAIFLRLRKEVEGIYSKWSLPPRGSDHVTVYSIIGPVTVLIKPDMEFPIFLGSDKEYEDNSFAVSMEKILYE